MAAFKSRGTFHQSINNNKASKFIYLKSFACQGKSFFFEIQPRDERDNLVQVQDLFLKTHP